MRMRNLAAQSGLAGEHLDRDGVVLATVLQDFHCVASRLGSGRIYGTSTIDVGPLPASDPRNQLPCADARLRRVNRLDCCRRFRAVADQGIALEHVNFAEAAREESLGRLERKSGKPRFGGVPGHSMRAPLTISSGFPVRDMKPVFGKGKTGKLRWLFRRKRLETARLLFL